MFWVELTLLYKVYDKLETAKHFFLNGKILISVMYIPNLWCKLSTMESLIFWAPLFHSFLKIPIHFRLIISAWQKRSNKKINDYSCIVKKKRKKNQMLFKTTSFRNTRKELRAQRKSQTSFKATKFSLGNSLFSLSKEWEMETHTHRERERERRQSETRVINISLNSSVGQTNEQR